MIKLTADQVSGLFTLPQLKPILPADALAMNRSGVAEPLDYGLVIDLLASIAGLNPAGPISPTDKVYILQGGTPVLTTVQQIVNFPPKPIGFVFAGGPPTTSQFLSGTVFPYAYTIPGNFAGAVGSIKVNPTATFVILVKKNGANVGTITISTLGVFTFATSGGAPISMAVGDALDFYAPAGVDATAAIIEWTIVATLT